MDNDKTGFKIGDNRYEVDVNCYTLDEVRKQLDLDLLKCFEDEEVLVKLGEPATFVAALYIFCEEDCERNGTEDPKSFARLFKDSDKLSEAMICLKNGLINFSPSHQKKALRKLMALQYEAENRMQEKTAAIVDSPRLQELIDLQLDKSEKQFMSALESLESEIRANGHSAN